MCSTLAANQWGRGHVRKHVRVGGFFSLARNDCHRRSVGRSGSPSLADARRSSAGCLCLWTRLMSSVGRVLGPTPTRLVRGPSGVRGVAGPPRGGSWTLEAAVVSCPVTGWGGRAVSPVGGDAGDLAGAEAYGCGGLDGAVLIDRGEEGAVPPNRRGRGSGSRGRRCPAPGARRPGRESVRGPGRGATGW